MSGPILLIAVVVLFPFGVIIWNRARTKGKIVGVVARRDKSVLFRLLELRDDFVIMENRAYELYPSLVRLCLFPMGWPRVLQEILPCILLDEEDRVPLDWIDIGKRQGSAMELKAALDENWLRKLVQEASTEGGFKFNWRKMLPIGLIVLGVVGVVLMLIMRSR